MLHHQDRTVVIDEQLDDVTLEDVSYAWPLVWQLVCGTERQAASPLPIYSKSQAVVT